MREPPEKLVAAMLATVSAAADWSAVVASFANLLQESCRQHWGSGSVQRWVHRRGVHLTIAVSQIGSSRSVPERCSALPGK